MRNMSAVDVVYTSLPKDALNSFENERFALFADGDNTLFLPRSNQLYPDADNFLANTNSEVTMLVSANPDKDLAIARADVIGTHYEIPKRQKWVKADLYSRAIGKAAEIAEFDFAIFMGDRFLMDVVIGKLAAKRAGISSYGVLVRRPETKAQPPTLLDKHILNRVEKAGYIASTAFHLDGFIRPRNSIPEVT